MMPYKPKYCCQCGEKIDRIDWKPWTSRRFCQLCETDFGIYDKLRGVLIVIGLLCGLYGAGSYFQKPERQLNVAPQQFAASNFKDDAAQPKTAAPIQTDNVRLPAQTSNSAAPTKTQNAPVETANLTTKPAKTKITEAAEQVYFCGAPTRKGTMCSRRVKNGGRCWQHAGQAALLPPEKLIAAQ
jgi:hypothetical protein